MTLGVAIIGCGLIGKKRAAGLPDGTRLTAVFDLDRSRAEALAAGVDYDVRVTASVKEAVTAVDVGAVIVATLHRDLASLTAESLEAGRHVLVEKPGACRPAELDDVQRLAASRDLVVRVGFNHRFHPAVLRARELLGGGRYGRLLHVRGRYGHGGRVGYEREWRAQPELSGGGELLDQGIHLIDLTRFLEGDADLAFAELVSAYWPMPVEDNAFLCLRVRSGGVAWLHASWTEWKNLFSLELTHERAKLEMFGLGGSYGTEQLTLYEMRPEMGPPDTSSWAWPREDRSWAAELADFFSAIAGKPSFGATLEDAAAALRIVQEAYQT